MSSFIRAGLLAAGILASSVAAQAADLGPRYKSPVYTAPAGYSWSGFYVGLNAGYHFGKDAVTTSANSAGWGAAGAAAIDSTTAGSVSPKGFIGGLQGGYNWQMGSFVFGLEADVDFMRGSASRSVTNFPVVNPADVYTTSAEATFMATLRPRLGWVVFDRGLIYGTAGLAMAKLKFTDTFGAFGNTSVSSVETSKTKFGWTAGLGFEYGITQRWSAKMEYLYADLGTTDAQIPSCPICGAGFDIPVHHKYTDHSLRFGVNYRF